MPLDLVTNKKPTCRSFDIANLIDTNDSTNSKSNDESNSNKFPVKLDQNLSITIPIDNSITESQKSCNKSFTKVLKNNDSDSCKMLQLTPEVI